MDTKGQDSLAWQAIAAGKQRERLERIRPEWRIDSAKYSAAKHIMHVPLTCGILSEKEIRLTSDFDAVSLVQKMKDGVYTVEDVVTAFCKRAAIAQQLTNCLTEILFEDAITKARQMDHERRLHPQKPLPAFYGLPVSLKDTFKLPGYDATVGYVAFANRPAKTHSALAALIGNLGGVIHCKTNVPQTMMTADTENNVFGRTLNPYNTSMTAGGSSGGEGALVAMRGSVMGVGTDIAGSIRIPSICNGLYGFKPTSSVVPFGGQESPVRPGIPGIMTCAGPMTSSARDCRFFLQSVIQASSWKYDPTSLHLPWSDWTPIRDSALRIGVLEDNGVHTPSPPMRRALNDAVEKLQAAGHQMVPLQMDGVKGMVEQCFAMYSMNGTQEYVDFMSASGEPATTAAKMIGLIGRPSKTTSEMISLISSREQARVKAAQIWTDHDIDVFLTPASAHTAVPHDTWTSLTYTAIYNYLDWPAVVLPTGAVNDGDLQDDGAKYGAEDQEVYGLYSGPQRYHGMPTSIQLVGQPQEDEKLSWYATVIDRVVNGTDF